MADISGATLAEYNIPMRSSVLGMKSLQRILEATGNPLAVTKIKIQENYMNANAQIAAAKMKSLGIKLLFHRDNDDDHEILRDAVMPLHISGFTIYDSPLKKGIYQRLLNEYTKYLNGIRLIESYPGEEQDEAWNHVFAMDEYKDSELITEDMKDMLKIITKRKHIYEMKERGSLTEEETEELLPELAIPDMD